MKKNLVTIVCLFFFMGMTQATTWRVPQNFNTIQEAINASTDGDMVLVAEGTYYENINFMGKKITVASLAARRDWAEAYCAGARALPSNIISSPAIPFRHHLGYWRWDSHHAPVRANLCDS